ncbi:MAG: prepilin peptidase [Phycisphaerales bacterium]|nr:prepilin peptidase [Phycisphaerales bacterium]
MVDWLAISAPHLMALAFVAALGACVGSFANVVAYRLPMGMSIINPPSRCTACGRRLRVHENLPIIGWAISRGRCWSCGSSISLQYPVIELLMAVLFAAAYWVDFAVDPGGWWGRGGASWFQAQGILGASPAFIALLVLIASLVAATITDIRTFTIPMEVTLTATLVGIVAWTVEGSVSSDAAVARWPLPAIGWGGVGFALGGGAGVLCANALLAIGVLKRSFKDYSEYVKDGETLAQYPHARREMRHECAFLLPIVLGALIGWFATRGLPEVPPSAIQGLCGSVLGYLVGCGVVWAVRIIATLAKGVEAMGMGDVHLVGAAGAVLGWVDPVAAFFIAPFSGLAWIGFSGFVGRLRGRTIRRELPYGPHLALAIVALVLLRPAFHDAGRLLFPGLIPAPRSLQQPIRPAQIRHLSDRPEGQRTSEKGLSDEEDMVCRR